jgi:dTDP-4-dehydrorhamnose 3,5-epimerase
VIFEETEIAGVWRVSPQKHEDDRGFFARSFCSEEFAAQGLPSVFEQSSISHTTRAGTIRGMHFQPDPFAEAKFVRCVRGSVYDVALDLRAGSASCGRWIAVVLSADNGVGLYLAPGIAHGFQVLEDNSDLLYQITPPYRPGYGAGVRWNDGAFKIDWPIADPFLSDRDAAYMNWRP